MEMGDNDVRDTVTYYMLKGGEDLGFIRLVGKKEMDGEMHVFEFRLVQIG